ncbi:MAG: site-2 protease family protein [Clostridia bacterium]|nr:site-2 protease family protein [Clostridia bacterium]
MILSLLQGGSLRNTVITLLLTLPVILIALVFHEVAHGYAAWKCGDPTAHNLGRLTLNPLKHLDPIGFLTMLLVGFGWAKPVPINTRYFRNPKRGMAITAVAGPLANLVLGVLSTIFCALFAALYIEISITSGQGFLLNCVYWLKEISLISALINFMLMAFNLIPIPPFDGSRLAFAFLPPKYYFAIMRYERQIMYGILITLVALSFLFDFSPSYWIAEKLANLIYVPTHRLFCHWFLPEDIFRYLFGR